MSEIIHYLSKEVEFCTDHHDITEILLKVALNTIKPFVMMNGFSKTIKTYSQ
jgi:hypothetical protein